MAPVTATARLKKDYARLMKDPVPYVVASPLHANILEWHYVVSGAPNTPFEGGYFHGKLVFPADFPFKPPSIYMLTPNGRFQTNARLCLSISDYHPDTWNPAWTVSTILTGLLSFMNENSPTLGSVSSTDAEKRSFARRSGAFNLKNKTFVDLFPELAAIIGEEERKASEETRSSSDSSITREKKRRNGAGGEADVGGQFGPAGAFAYNIFVLVGVVALAFAVKYVMSQVAGESTTAETDV